MKTKTPTGLWLAVVVLSGVIMFYAIVGIGLLWLLWLGIVYLTGLVYP